MEFTSSLWKPSDPTQNDYGAVGEIIRQTASSFLNVRKAGPADSTAVGPLIRQDLDPEIYKLFVRKFPLYEMIEKIPSNGLVHAFNQKTSFGDALYQTETGSVVDDESTYNRATANIAVLATRRGVTLKAQFAVRQGGMAYDPEAEELASGLTALRHKMQQSIFCWQDTDSGSTTTATENGKYDANAFNGLRYTLNNVSDASMTIPVDITSGDTTLLITQAIKKASDQIINFGGEPSLIFGNTTACRLLDNEQLQFVRYVNSAGTEIVPGLRVKEVDAGQALLPMLRVPGDANPSIVDTHTYEELYVADMNALKLAYLGGPTPTVLEIPIGTDGKLQKLFIPFCMAGLAVVAPNWVARVKIETVA